MKAVRALLVAGVPLALVALPRFGGTAVFVTLLEVVLGAVFVSLLSRRPDRALLLLVLLLPVQTLLLALLLRAGLPVPVIKVLALAKEAVVASLVVAAARQRRHVRWDVLDKLVLGYIGLVSVYLVVPFVAKGVFVDVPFGIRAVAWRYDALFAVAFLAARRIAWSPRAVRRLLVAVTGVAVVMASCAAVELLSPSTWSSFLIHGARIRLFRALVNGNLTRPTDELVHTTLGGQDVVRVGGAALSPLALGFFLVIALAFALERLTDARRRVPKAAVALLIAAALVATLTRSAILGGLVVAAVTVRLGAVRRRPGRVQLMLGVALVAVLVAPLAGSSTVAERASSALGNDESAAGHKTLSLQSLTSVAQEPLGRGLGTNPATGQRFDVKRQLDSENAYLQVGAELGVGTMAVFIAMLVALLLALRRAAREERGDFGLASATFAAGCGLALVGFFLHVWLDLATALVFWSLAGVALAQRAAVPASGDEEQLAPVGRVALGSG